MTCCTVHIQSSDNACKNYTVKKNSRLRKFGLLKLFFRSIKKHVGKIYTKSIIGSKNHFLSFNRIVKQILCHSNILRTLTWKQKTTFSQKTILYNSGKCLNRFLFFIII